MPLSSVVFTRRYHPHTHARVISCFAGAAAAAAADTGMKLAARLQQRAKKVMRVIRGSVRNGRKVQQGGDAATSSSSSTTTFTRCTPQVHCSRRFGHSTHRGARQPASVLCACVCLGAGIDGRQRFCAELLRAVVFLCLTVRRPSRSRTPH